jgi:hypothetical protein
MAVAVGLPAAVEAFVVALLPGTPLFAEVAARPGTPHHFTARRDPAAMDSYLIEVDGEIFMATDRKRYLPGSCSWRGSSVGGGSVHLTIADDGLEGHGEVRRGGGRSAHFHLNAGQASSFRRSGCLWRRTARGTVGIEREGPGEGREGQRAGYL